MPLQAQDICNLARQIAKCPGYTSQSGQYLNQFLRTLALDYDFDVGAKATFNFTFLPALTQIGNFNAQLASGPFTLPVDYLRAKRGDVMWFLQNYPYQLIPIDLEEFDIQVQQAGVQSFPTLWATDMSQAAPILSTTGNTHGTTALDSLISVAGVSVGNGVSGPGIVPGTTVTVVTPGSPLSSVTLSQATTSSVTGGSFFFGVCPIAYVWPPASAAYPCMVRYFKLPPDIATPESSTAIPWFQDQDLLIDGVAGRLMKLTGDDRWTQFLGEDAADGVPKRLSNYMRMKDDSSNRAKRVYLDRRRFGPTYGNLPASKILGY